MIRVLLHVLNSLIVGSFRKPHFLILSPDHEGTEWLFAFDWRPFKFVLMLESVLYTNRVDAQ